MRKTILLGVVALAIVATACTIDTGAQRSTSSPAVGNAFGTPRRCRRRTSRSRPSRARPCPLS